MIIEECWFIDSFIRSCLCVLYVITTYVYIWLTQDFSGSKYLPSLWTFADSKKPSLLGISSFSVAVVET